MASHRRRRTGNALQVYNYNYIKYNYNYNYIKLQLHQEYNNSQS